MIRAAPGVDVGPFAVIREGGEPPKPRPIAIDEVASAEWDRCVSLLMDRAILSPADAGILAAYCSAYSTWHRIRLRLDGLDPVVVNEKSGAIKAHPLFGVLSGAESSMARYAAALGMTPTDRGRVEAVDDDDAGESLSTLDRLNAAAAATRNRQV